MRACRHNLESRKVPTLEAVLDSCESLFVVEGLRLRTAKGMRTDAALVMTNVAMTVEALRELNGQDAGMTALHTLALVPPEASKPSTIRGDNGVSKRKQHARASNPRSAEPPEVRASHVRILYINLSRAWFINNRYSHSIGRARER